MKTTWILTSLLGLCATASANFAQKQHLIEALHGRSGDKPVVQRDEKPIEARTTSPDSHRFLSAKTEKFAVNGTTVPEVDFDVGESYAGLLPITNKTNERDHLFFWFFPSVNEEAKKKKEIVIWLNGGPGCSSLIGFLQENGPFLWQPGTLKPAKNPFGWQLLSNIVWVEQPVTVGFSQGNATISNEDELAEQFLGFWKNFIETFSLQGYKVYIAAESYGGMYGPYISSHMLNANDKTHYDLQGLLIYDGLIADNSVQSNVPVASFLREEYNVIPLDDNVQKQINNASEACGYSDYHKKYLTYPPSAKQPDIKDLPWIEVDKKGQLAVKNGCDDIWDTLNDHANVLNPCFNPYHVSEGCPQTYDPLGSKDVYFDREDVKKAVHAPTGTKWSQCVRGVFKGNNDNSDAPTGYQLPHVIEKTNNVIIAHGSLDYVLPLNGVLLGIQNTTWNGKLGFQTKPSDPFYVPLYGANSQKPYYGDKLPAGSGVLGTAHHERGLTLAVTALAGHEGPQYSGAGAFRHLEKLLGRVHSLSDTAPFTLPELKGIKQLPKPLGKGTVRIPFI